MWFSLAVIEAYDPLVPGNDIRRQILRCMMRIFFIDPSHESSLGLGSDTMPYQLGLIAAFCQKQLGDGVEVEIFKYLSDLAEAVEQRRPDVIAISNYLWNHDLGLAVTRAIKHRYPDVLAVFGGPNYPDYPDEQVVWLQERPEIDVYVYKDGEAPFAALIGEMLAHGVDAARKAALPSCHAVIDGVAYFGPLAERIRDLAVIPSPHLNGMMDKFYDGRLLPVIQTNRGCPFSCTFCVEGKAYYNKVYKDSVERKTVEVDYIAAHVKGTRTLRITDSNFGMYPEDVAFSEYLGGLQKRTGYPEYIYCSAGKNKQERILKCNELVGGAMRLTASVQSLEPDVLAKIKRSNISLDAMMALSDATSDTITHSYSETIIALPGESLRSLEYTADQLIQAGINTIIQHQLALLYGTEMASQESRTQYALKTRFRPVQRCLGIYDLFGKSFKSIEVEEICVATDTMSWDDYLDGRRLYFTIVSFYNDRIFGEIHALLRILGLNTFGWLRLVNNGLAEMDGALKQVYDEFINETIEELWETPEDLRRDFEENSQKYLDGDVGLNVIYKYKAMALFERFDVVAKTAYQHLRAYLAENNVFCDDLVDELERYTRHHKLDMFNFDYDQMVTFSYDIPRMISDLPFVRAGGTIDQLRYPVTLHFHHTDDQVGALRRQLDFYGNNMNGYTMMLSRYPLKRFYRSIEVLAEAKTA